jgi:hypothetical protein
MEDAFTRPSKNGVSQLVPSSMVRTFRARSKLFIGIRYKHNPDMGKPPMGSMVATQSGTN